MDCCSAAAIRRPPPCWDGPNKRPARPASFIYQWFTDPAARLLYHPDEHQHQSQVFVADIRAVAARRGGDRMVTDLTSQLLKQSAEFSQLWHQQDVAIRRSDRKRLIHPTIGEIELNCLSLLSEDGTQRLLWFTPPAGSAAVEQLELLNVVGNISTSDQTLRTSQHGR